MSKNPPLFSIVIPTRNRAHLLPNALRSALNQQFDDYEIVVVDNDCQDNTREIVQSMANSRVRYVETGRTFSMPDNWDFAWTKAEGKYVTYLCDDDALVPTALECLANNAMNDSPAVISWEDATYYYPDWNDEKLRNILLMFYYGDHLVEDVPSIEMRKQLAQFEFAWSAPIPKMLNCAVDRMFFEKWREKLGRLFFPASPDYAFAWIATHVSPYIRVVRKPLTVRGVSDNSIGSNGGHGPNVATFLKEFGEFEFFAKTKITLPLSTNFLVDTFLRTHSGLSAHNVEPEKIDPVRFHTVLAKQLHESRELLRDWDKHASEYLEWLRLYSPDLYENTKAMLAEPLESTITPEPLRMMHQRTRAMALEYLPNIETAMKRYSGDLQAALCSLALQDELLVDASWNYLYLFCEVLKAKNIYEVSLLVDRYYDLLSSGKNKLQKLPPEGQQTNEMTENYDELQKL